MIDAKRKSKSTIYYIMVIHTVVVVVVIVDIVVDLVVIDVDTYKF